MGSLEQGEHRQVYLLHSYSDYKRTVGMAQPEIKWTVHHSTQFRLSGLIPARERGGEPGANDIDARGAAT